MDEPLRTDVAVAGGASAVSWGAVIAGAIAAIAVSLLLFALATGLDLVVLSPDRTAPLASVGAVTAVALIVTQWLSSSLGGYLTGRLRTRWVGTHTHEVFFRDTAHGFLTWCVASIFMATGVASTAGAFMGTGLGMRAHSTGASGWQQPAPTAYRADQLILPQSPSGVDFGRNHLVRLLPAQSIVSDSGADRYPVMALAGEADRRDAAAMALFTALSMLVGAFIAGVSAALGGRRRDLHP